MSSETVNAVSALRRTNYSRGDSHSPGQRHVASTTTTEEDGTSVGGSTDTNGAINNGVYYPGQSQGGLIAVADRNGIIHWVTDPEHPYAATPTFVARFSGSPEEVNVATTIIEISAGNADPYKVLNAQDIQLPGGKNANYDIYTVWPEGVSGPGRIANVPGSNIYYYSPYHYNPGPDVPNAWVQLMYPAPHD